jgi:hypothetical protein
MSAGMEDRFNPGHTYKYWAVGELYQNNRFIPDKPSRLWVPEGFPHIQTEEGRWETNPQDSPVTWVVFSNGPRFDWWTMKQANYPVPKKTWYNPSTRKGILVRMRMKNAHHIGTHEK